jgi:Gnt-I system low-affinity gluconate transporter
MIDYQILLAVVAGIALLLLLILKVRLQAFLSLLIASIAVGLLAGMPAADIIDSIKNGMGDTLGFVATVVGLGAMFGAILEHSGGAHSIAQRLLKSFGEKNAPMAMMLTGFVVAIPVFFDVAFIILIPVIYALQRKTKKSLLLYAIPLLAGLATTHAFVPPTPGPIAVAEILGASLGWVIVAGLVAGLPTALVAGLLYGKYIADKIHVDAPPLEDSSGHHSEELPNVFMILTIIGMPIVLILLETVLSSPFFAEAGIPGTIMSLVKLIGHPFVALIIANLMAWYLLGVQRGMSREKLFEISTKSMAPAGVIILLTGAGGVFKQILIDTGGGKMLAEAMTSMGIPVIVFAFLSAVFIRIIQGSATVAMITAAGMTAPLVGELPMDSFQGALLVIAIAAGASILSHVNDSGFWLVSPYLGLTEKETFRSWSVMTTVLALTGFLVVVVLWGLDYGQ